MAQERFRGVWRWLSILAIVLGAVSGAQAGPVSDQLKGDLAHVFRVIEETSLAPDNEPEEGVPWHAVALLLTALALLIAVEITLAFGIAKLVTGHAY